MAILSRDGRSLSHHPATQDPIRVTAKQHGYFPKAFVWRGRAHDVEAVERCWTVLGRSWFGRAPRVERHCFRVRCAEGVFHLYQDLRDNAWYVERRQPRR